MGVQGAPDRWVCFNAAFDSGLAGNRLLESQVSRSVRLEERFALKAELGEAVTLRRHLSCGDATDEMGLYVFRFRLRGVVHIAPDVQVVVVRVGNL